MALPAAKQEEIGLFYNPKVAKLRTAYDKAANQQNLILVPIVVATIAIAGIIAFNTGSIGGAIPILIFGTAGSFVAKIQLLTRLNKKFNQRYKTEVIHPSLKMQYPDIEYKPDIGFGQKAIARTKLIDPKANQIASSDYIKYTVGNTIVQFSNVLASQTSRNNDTELFRGAIMAIAFNKYFQGEYLLVDRSYRSIASVLYHALGGAGKAIELESPEFNKVFALYGKSEQQARYILSPALMQKILDLQQHTKAPLSFSFRGQMMYIAIPMKHQLFSMHNSSQYHTQRYIINQLAVFERLLHIVEELDLNTRIWSRE